MRNVGKTFSDNGKSIAALENVSMKVMPGEIFGVAEGSGCGKSTKNVRLDYLECKIVYLKQYKTKEE